VVESGEDVVRMRVPRARVAAAAAEILRTQPVADLTIEEADISTIVERILSERGTTP
jgi:hypothetical protein